MLFILREDVFKKLNNDAVWKARPDKKRNFINAFALAYDDLLFAGKTAAMFPVTFMLEKNGIKNRSHAKYCRLYL